LANWIRIGSGTLKSSSVYWAVDIVVQQDGGTYTITQGRVTIGGSGDAEYPTGTTVAPWRTVSTTDYYFNYSAHCTEVVIEDGIQRLDLSYGFAYGSHVESVDLGNTLTYIGDNCFYWLNDTNTPISGIVIPDSVTELGEYAFSSSRVESYTVGTGITEIPEGCFFNNPYTKSVSILGDVTDIGNSAFVALGGRVKTIDDEYCVINIPSTVTDIGDMAFYQAQMGNTQTTAYNINLPALESVGDSAFAYSSVVVATFPDSLTSLGVSVFQHSEVQAVYMGGGLTAIPEYTFDNCASLAFVNIPQGYTSIGSCAFSNIGTQGDTNSPVILIPYGLTNIYTDDTNHTGAFEYSWGEIVVDNYRGSIPYDPWGFLGLIVYTRMGNIFLKENGSLTRLTPYIKENGSLVPLDWVPGKAISY